MSISFEVLRSAHEQAARVLLQQYWRQDWSDEFAQRFFTWRYLTRPSGETLLALDNSRCVAILDSFLRPYLVSGNPVTVRETCDWFCLPEYRPLGVGISLMRRMMARPEPIIVIGASKAAQSLLERLKWQRLPDVAKYFLPVSARALASAGLRQLGAGAEFLTRAIPPRLKLRRPRLIPPPSPSTQVCISSNAEIASQPNSDAYGVAATIDGATLRWWTCAPKEAGSLMVLNFVVDGGLTGTSVSRLIKDNGALRAQILHLQSTPQSHTITGWILGETARHLVASGAGLITCWSSCPIIDSMLRKIGFLYLRALPAIWWSRGGVAPSGPAHLTMNRGDEALWSV